MTFYVKNPSNNLGKTYPFHLNLGKKYLKTKKTRKTREKIKYKTAVNPDCCAPVSADKCTSISLNILENA